jgi:hypothetical protein
VRSLLFAALALSIAIPAAAVNRSARVSGNWNDTNVWSNSNNCGATPPASFPVAGDGVWICPGVKVTLTANAAAENVEIRGTGELDLNGFTLTISDTPALNLLSGAIFTANGGTLRLTNNANTTVATGAGTVTSLALGTLTIDYAVGNAARSYTLAAGTITTMTMSGDLNFKPIDNHGGANTQTLSFGTLAGPNGLSVTGTTTLQGTPGTNSNDSTALNTGAVPFTSGRIVLGGGGTTGTDTLAAASSTITLNGGSGTLFTRNTNGVFTAGTSRVVMSPTTGLTLTSGTFNGANAFNRLTVTLPSGQTGTLGAAIAINSTSTTAGDEAFRITSGALADGGFQIAGNTTGQMTMAANTNLLLGNAGTATTFPSGFDNAVANTALDVASTVTYNSDQAQTLSATPVYGNVVLASTAAVTKTPSAGMNIDGSLTINASNTLAAGAFTHTLAGNFTNNGTYAASTGTMTFDGTATAAIAGSAATTFHNMTVNKPGTTLTITTSPTVNNTLTLTAGTVVTGSNKVSLAAAATVSPAPAAGSSTAHVQGNVEKFFNASNRTFTYPVGDGASYTPITVDFTASANAPNGNLTATTSSSANIDHHDALGGRAGIDAGKSVNRWWTLKGHPGAANLTAGGTVAAPTTYTVTLNYRSGSPYSDALTPANVKVVRGEACFTSGATRTCNPWGSLATSGASATQATGSGGVLVAKDLEADFVVGETAAARFVRQREFIYIREQY